MVSGNRVTIGNGDAAYENWGLGLEYPNQSGCSVFTLGMNVDYLDELFEGDEIRIETTLFDYDSKRIHYFHEMFREATGHRVSTNECLCMNVSLETRKGQAFPDGVQRVLESTASPKDPPDGIGRTLAIRRH